MRVLVVGAGAVGGYFGGRLLQAGRDVTFLVRPRRAAQLAETGLVIDSSTGNATLASPTVQADALQPGYDLILLSCKAYDLDTAIASFAPAVGPATLILPLLNGMAHLDRLDSQFGPGRVLGGQCVISATLDDAGRILHLNTAHAITLGARSPGLDVRPVADLLRVPGFETRVSDRILGEMWEKWVFLAALAAGTCLMRSTVGDIVTAGGAARLLDLIDETAGVAAASGYPARPSYLERVRGMITAPDSTMAASMLRDVERGSRTEASHILEDLVRRGEEAGRPCPLLALASLHLRAYAARQAREAG